MRFYNTVAGLSGITWKQFFYYRSQKRLWERTSAFIGGTLGSFGAGYYFFSVADFDPTQPLFGLPDPTIAYVGGAMICGAIATASSLQFGGVLWRLSKTKQGNFLRIIDEKERDFFSRLSKHRPKDIKFINVPGSGEVALPDYYGEKIHSIKDYKEWIKSQRKFIARNMGRV